MCMCLFLVRKMHRFVVHLLDVCCSLARCLTSLMMYACHLCICMVYVWGGNSERWWLWRFRMYKVRKGLRGARVGGWVYVLWCWLTTVVQWSPNPSSLCEVNKLGFGYPSNTWFILFCCWVSSRFLPSPSWTHPSPLLKYVCSLVNIIK